MKNEIEQFKMIDGVRHVLKAMFFDQPVYVPADKEFAAKESNKEFNNADSTIRLRVDFTYPMLGTSKCTQ